MSLIETVLLNEAASFTYRRVKKARTDLLIQYTRRFQLKQSYDSAFDLCLSSMQTLSGFILSSQDRAKGHITARIGCQEPSAGESLEWKVKTIEEAKTHIEIVSRTNSLYRWRKAGDNLNGIVRFLTGDHELLLRASETPGTEHSELLHPAQYNAEGDIQQLLHPAGQESSLRERTE